MCVCVKCPWVTRKVLKIECIIIVSGTAPDCFLMTSIKITGMTEILLWEWFSLSLTMQSKWWASKIVAQLSNTGAVWVKGAAAVQTDQELTA